MAEIIYDDGADLSLIQSKKVAIIGYGSQGHAHALNLRIPELTWSLACVPVPPLGQKAEAAGLEVKDVPEAVGRGRTLSPSSCPTRCSVSFTPSRSPRT